MRKREIPQNFTLIHNNNPELLFIVKQKIIDFTEEEYNIKMKDENCISSDEFIDTILMSTKKNNGILEDTVHNFFCSLYQDRTSNVPCNRISSEELPIITEKVPGSTTK